LPRVQKPGVRKDRLPVAGHGYDPELLVGRVVTHLNDHLADPSLDLEQLADAAHVSPSSLGRAFRDVLDTTPWRYVMRRRIDHAKRLLAHTDRPLADIALDAGFYDQAHFSRTFKRFTDTTPGTFREENRDENRDADAEEQPEVSSLVLEDYEA
jgi:transcriptional regulator GlxA family with amidase domain